MRINQEIGTGLSPLRANPIRIRQMIENLLGNAVKYTPEGGEITIRAQEEDKQIIFEVKDTGPGIPLDEQAHVFDKFFRASNVTSTKGTGLGLAIVKNVVDSYHGRVWVESVVGQGASFFVVLPTFESKEP